MEGRRNPCNPGNLGNLVTFYKKIFREKIQQTCNPVTLDLMRKGPLDGQRNPCNSGNLGNLVTFYKKYEEKN